MEGEFLKFLLVGNPNCGKSTIFNSLVGGNAHVGNYSGVTVEKKTGSFELYGVKIEVEDLPGLYSLSPSSAEEAIVRDTISSGDFDLIVNVIDSSNLERNLFLTIQLAEMGLPMAVVLNMADELEKTGADIDEKIFSSQLGAPAIKCVGYKASSANSLKQFLLEAFLRRREPNFLWSKFRDKKPYPEVSEISHLIRKSLPSESAGWSRWLAIRAIEGDKPILEKISAASKELAGAIKAASEKIESDFGESAAALISAARFKLASDIAAKSLKSAAAGAGAAEAKPREMYFLDKIFLNRFLGLPIFFAMMFLTFQFVFTLGDPLMGYMEDFFSGLREWLGAAWAGGGFLKSLVIDGIIGGVGGVLVFLPNILMLFFALAVLEDSGYMARAAFLCDRIMRRFGLSGASLIPMLVGFGCSVPAIMATRSLKSKSERIASIMVLPLFSCGSRMPIYILLIPCFFAEKYSGLAMFSIYLTGIILAFVLAKILRAGFLKKGESAFVLELPAYRLPRPMNMLRQICSRAWSFLKKAGTIILAASILLWAAATFPQKAELSKDYGAMAASVEKNETLSGPEKSARIAEIDGERRSEIFEYTAMGRAGKALEPVLSPLGFDAKISSALLGAIAAKEVFVSQLGIVYGMGGDGGGDSVPLREKLTRDYTPIQGISILLFILISMPCVATVAAAYTETRSAKIAFAQVAGLTLLAYAVCFAFYNIATLFY
ncbi:MAG: ferrous iron transport protein B [Opitutales bacterium]|nr:ferrous iron transport protein B [Opitutales bacterium]